ncbi:MAG: hypothetical protein EBX17_05835 [Betaproteobacteria bacterium]|nr:hypothetical protein [Betaproteobacteria bacterium]
MFLGKNSRSPMNQQAIAELPGLGPMSAAMLAGVGITSVAQLKRLGSAYRGNVNTLTQHFFWLYERSGVVNASSHRQ